MLKITAEPRAVFGKKLKKERQNGRLPVVAYGRKEASMPLFVDGKSFGKLLAEAGETSVIDLEIAGGESHEVLIHDVALDPVTHTPIHADLYVVEKGKTVEVAIPLSFIGVPPAVKNLGGTLVKVLHEVTIKALPRDLPHELIVPVEKLQEIHSHILVSDILLPEGVTLITGGEEIVASISSPRGEEVEEISATVDLSAIEVEKKGKKEEEATDAEASA
jgi:large subunit ribosomal protein L25